MIADKIARTHTTTTTTTRPPLGGGATGHV